MRWVPAALLVVLTATACAGGDAEPGAVATPTPTPTSELLAGSEPPQGLRPAVTASPEASRFRWLPLVDEASGSRVALPEGSRPIANTVTGPDGTTIVTRGFVFEHDRGVIGSEMIDDYATLDDLEKLADFLAASVGGAVVATEEIDLGQDRGSDGEIVYDDDQVMLFRILVLNSDGDQTNGDESGERGYHHSDGMGFVVIEVPPDSYDLDAGLDDLATSVDAAIESSTPIDVQGYQGADGVAVGDEWLHLIRVILLDDQVLVLYTSGPPEDRGRLTNELSRMAETVVLP